MSTSTIEARAAKLWFEDDSLWVLLQDGRKLATPLTYFPKLLKASESQRAAFELSGGGIGIHWDALDEDISVAGLLAGNPSRERSER
ncbi:MAG: hypothetical protein AUJ52_09065 [Elusimicrobia bacterium CG1_02_63_36]|nr:MAG: hypothetical protein AUJ52_09065 [Elusimicrobia bacterium CG1_02_63_36]PIP83774.1 MAG: hypothetical protein COR54_07765 [Elusimicrobia bacterium CG22_combo_CG10-13_8_21_14_all_63_91]PJA16787.1 MAG: DUF2442 domain-containing protein [Elusimicrobia bacterium CG_4_10_14_0_2_um_filter_63_34]PJB25595.1 MAG: DUF2442 domain-containing protein [Elusimicrobia bacterium CG_4_9_14_3_um_filter_62_55]